MQKEAAGGNKDNINILQQVQIKMGGGGGGCILRLLEVQLRIFSNMKKAHFLPGSVNVIANKIPHVNTAPLNQAMPKKCEKR